MKMSQEKVEFGTSLMTTLESLLNELDPKTSNLDLQAIIEYMEHIRGKMINAYYHQQDSEEILGQISKMNKCISAVRKMIKQENASSM